MAGLMRNCSHRRTFYVLLTNRKFLDLRLITIEAKINICAEKERSVEVEEEEAKGSHQIYRFSVFTP
jgi:hypothetical protein